MRKHPDYAALQISPIYRFGLFLRNREFYSNPVLAVGVLILKSLEYIVSGLGYLSGSLGLRRGAGRG